MGLISAFIKRDKKSVDFNYDLNPLIERFYKDGMYALICSPNVDSPDNGAYLAISEKQYILALNHNYGTGTHMLSGARIYGELTGNPLEDNNVLKYSSLFEQIVIPIYARVLYECVGIDENGRAIYSGSIVFPLANKKFNSKTIDMFMQFYNDYNKEIKSICNKFHFSVFFSYRDDENKNHTNETDNLDNLRDYIISRRDDNIISYFDENNIDEKIIGTTNNSRVK